MWILSEVPLRIHGGSWKYPIVAYVNVFMQRFIEIKVLHLSWLKISYFFYWYIICSEISKSSRKYPLKHYCRRSPKSIGKLLLGLLSKIDGGDVIYPSLASCSLNALRLGLMVCGSVGHLSKGVNGFFELEVHVVWDVLVALNELVFFRMGNRDWSYVN